MISKANQLASITAAGVSAIALTSGKAEAAIIDSGILNTPIIFQSNSNPGSLHFASSALFHSLAGGPSFAIQLFSVASSNGAYNRFAVETMNTLAAYLRIPVLRPERPGTTQYRMGPAMAGWDTANGGRPHPPLAGCPLSPTRIPSSSSQGVPVSNTVGLNSASVWRTSTPRRQPMARTSLWFNMPSTTPGRPSPPATEP
jgi:hypothetical protein